MRYLSVTSPDINNGTGCRVTVWVAGCSHCCKGCHNPETWDYNQGKTMTGEVWNQLHDALSNPHIFGVTFSGGDPLAQNEKSLIELSKLIDTIKDEFPTKDIWLYTGDVYEDIIQDPLKKEIIDKCDVLVDGPFKLYLMDLSLAFRGSSNQRVILINENYPYKIAGSIKRSEI